MLSAPFLLLSSTAFSAARSVQAQEETCTALADAPEGNIVWKSAPGAVSVSALASAPRLIGTPSLSFPAVARQAGVSGPVCVQVKIDDQGRVRKAHAVCGPSVLRGYAEHKIRSWRYTPALSEGRPVEATGYVVLNFRAD
jgi:outer membrane biosynthesis protein TonB